MFGEQMIRWVGEMRPDDLGGGEVSFEVGCIENVVGFEPPSFLVSMINHWPNSTADYGVAGAKQLSTTFEKLM